jgi:hypothetical protein
MGMDQTGTGQGEEIPINRTVSVAGVLFMKELEIIPTGQKGLKDPFGLKTVYGDKMLGAKDTDPAVFFIGEGVRKKNRLTSFDMTFRDPVFQKPGRPWRQVFRTERAAHLQGLFDQRT